MARRLTAYLLVLIDQDIRVCSRQLTKVSVIWSHERLLEFMSDLTNNSAVLSYTTYHTCFVSHNIYFGLYSFSVPVVLTVVLLL